VSFETGALGWLELSPAALRQMRRELSNEGEDTVDDMGVQALHVGYADKFFPGTSVLHTRPRYLFFTCWNLLYFKKSGTTATSFAREKTACEMWVTKQLRQTGIRDPSQKQEGIIGGRVYPNAPAQPPDFAYWTALRTFGFYRGVDRSALARRWDPSRVERVSTTAALGDKDDEIPPDRLAQLRVPEPPHWWRQEKPRQLLTFDLTKEEAEFLKTRLESLEQASVLGRAARRAARQATSGDAPWSDPLILDAARDLGSVTSAQLGRAQLASSLAELVRATYAALVEKVRNRTVSPAQKKAIESPRACEEHLLAYWGSGASILDDVRRIDLGSVVADIPALVGGTLLPLLEHLQNRVRQSKTPREAQRLLLDDPTEDIFQRIETRRKGRLARLPHTPAGAERRAVFTENTIRVYGLDYRWTQVRNLLRDLRAGLLR
jgi:hypothetical protein